MFTRTNLTSEQIRDEAIRIEINSYLKDGETLDSLLKTTNGNLIKLVQNLREREFLKLESPVKKSNTSNPVMPLATLPVKSKGKKKPSPSDKNQSDLF